MVLYDDQGNEALVEKSQVELMLDSGWMKEKPESKSKAAKEVEEVEEVKDPVEANSEEDSEESTETETSDATATTKPKTIRKLGKK